MFDTHCHLNFSAFNKNFDDVINNAKLAGVHYFVIPGTDYKSSKRAVEIAEQYEGVFAAVGIHPHHVYTMYQKARHRVFRPPHPKGTQAIVSKQVSSLSELLLHPKVVAVGEVGVDRHYYKITKYPDYQINESFIDLQKEFLKEQIKLAVRYHKSLILHNRKAKKDLLKILTDVWSKNLEGRIVFHCCESDDELLDFAIRHNVFIGVDGDVTYSEPKQEFIKKVPLDLLVLETDSPFLLPEPLRSQKKYPNEPKNVRVIAERIAKIKNVSINQLIDTTTENAKRLFQVF